jgi:hypothetical protein
LGRRVEPSRAGLAENGPARPKRRFDENENCGLWKMIFSGINLTGAYTVDIDRREDNRGYFAHPLCEKEFFCACELSQLSPLVVHYFDTTAPRYGVEMATSRYATHTHTHGRPLR